MKSIVANLFELQNLHLQTKGSRVSEIGALRKKIPAQLLVNFDRSQLRGKKSVSIVRNCVCNECHIQVPLGVVTSLASGEEMLRCGNCGRYLYLPAGEPVLTPPVVPPKPVKARRKKDLVQATP